MSPVRHQRLGVDVAGGRGVGGEAAERGGIGRGLRVAGRGGLEVVDLLEPGLVSGNALVVLVRPGARTSSRRGDDLADDERRRVQRVRGPEVVHLPGVAPRPRTSTGTSSRARYRLGLRTLVGASATATRPLPLTVSGVPAPV